MSVCMSVCHLIKKSTNEQIFIKKEKAKKMYTINQSSKITMCGEAVKRARQLNVKSAN